MGMTMIEKILARAAGRDHVEVGEFVVCDVDMTVLIDLQFATMWASPTRIHDPQKLAVIMDHAVPAPTSPTPTAVSAPASSSPRTASSGSSTSASTASATR